MADYYSYRALPEAPEETTSHFVEMAGLLRHAGATHFRYTVVHPEAPMPPYPDGLYVEGWNIQPSSMDYPAFEFPLTTKEKLAP